MLLKNGRPTDAGISEIRAERFEKLFPKWVDEGFTPSISYLAARNGIIFSHGAAGNLGPDKNSPPLKPDDIFPIASITKLFTATAIMILTEEGYLSPVSPVKDYIPEFCGEGKENVLINHLLTHTSGLNDEDIRKHAEKIAPTAKIPEHEKTQHPEIARRLFLGYGAPLSREIGTYMSYCSYGYELLGEIVRRVVNMPLERFFKERIFDPLGMRDTYMNVPENVFNRVVKFPENSVAGEWFSKPESLAYPSASGGAYTTVYDLSVFGQMFLNEGKYGDTRILSKATVRAMIKNHTNGISSGWGSIKFPESGWGLGFMISIDKKDESGTLRSPEAFSHSGYGCTYLFMDPVYNVVLTCFQVTMKKTGEELNRRFDRVTDVILAGIED